MIDEPLPDESEEMPEPPSKGATSIPVAGIGGSAGGLEVFKHLLVDLPADTGLAIVFVQHLDPKHHSMLSEILSRSTPMPVSEVADGMPVEANHVYVIPPNVDLAIEKGVLRLAPRMQGPGAHMPIDRFLRSLADECGSRAIGVILSGAGTDGSAGIQAIKAAGGVTFAQDQYTAKFASMPQSAVATNCVDFVLPPDRIAAELVRIGRHPYLAESSPAEPARMRDDDDAPFAAILAVVHGATGIDFSLYREKTIKRRIQRRLALRNIDSLAEYAARLEDDAEELGALQRDLLISVTSFFRDPGSFESLKKLVFPRLLQGRAAHTPVRVWVPGCATGEEAFSIAISLSEYLKETGASFPVQIFASDISEQSIEKARAGKYLENIAADISAERLNRYFTKVDSRYQINKDLREMCIFTRHNLLADPPFSKLDLVSCRNVLIYLASVQKNIIPLFHYALKSNGFLMLGASETAAFPELFSLVDREHRIYSRRETARKPYPFRTGSGAAFGGGHEGNKAAAEQRAELWDAVGVRQEVDRLLLSRYSPAGVVVDEELEVLEIRGKANAFLSLPAGKVSFNLLKLIPETSLFLEVEKLVRQAMSSGESARQERIPVDRDGHSGQVTVEVLPLRARQKTSLLILFEPEAAAGEAEPAAAPPVAGEPDDAKDRQIAHLKQELSDAKERFLAVLEEHQTSREESQNTTEETLSTNEELQSLNEELETAKEELQSTNEELITVNDELQVKNAALAKARDFAMSIVETVRQPLLVLDMELRVKMANRAFYRLFRVSPLEAEGRLVYALSEGPWDIPALRSELEVLVHGGLSFPTVEIERDFPSVGRKFLVVGGSRIEHLKMILLSVEDVSDRKNSEEALRRSEEHLRQSQKMEAIGRLAGGIAHDFNNLLTAVIGYSSLLLDSLAGNEEALQQVREIKSAGDRAASLTKQLLAFSRRQILLPKVIDLNLIVADFDRMLRRLVGERIQVVLDCAPDLWQARADPGEIGRAIMNLSLNARDAMPSDGTLTIQTANLTLTGDEARAADLPPGRFVTLSVHDTGVGMDAQMQEHIFEPFFTTKETGKGTGLGLATVLGIVEQSGGAIQCQSEVGEGTSFKILLPALAEAIPQSVKPPAGLATAPGGTESVLLVEDEDSVRELVKRILLARGYAVMDARNGREGLELVQSHPGKIDLLVTDVVMPELGGRELAEAALKLRPELKVVFVSGHIQDVILKEGVKQGAAFLQKPFTPMQLAQKVRETLDA
jgi:two-component system, chemotaxis family, CheB/CheR fusion protein